MITAPRYIGGAHDFDVMCGQLGMQCVTTLLEVSPATVRRWRQENAKVPRAAVLALFWETHWGRAIVDSHNAYERQLLHRQIIGLKKENARLRALSEKLMYTGDFGAANEPILRF
ncbi:hypothetical protein CAter10_2503 [Collimonas arenae]|uniref:hypothetical protein n=1 Tax=Collimonas arenae TaxID=279058 RepID=UPI000778740D|nr:hypothetical protein [Collimonas arenae]AMP00148.1 hypothetical protein CAter10_2503 [Collimonas arenae]